MYILNADIENLLSFTKKVETYLLNNGVPAMKRVNGTVYFAKSKLIKKTLSDAPFWVRTLARREVNID